MNRRRINKQLWGEYWGQALAVDWRSFGEYVGDSLINHQGLTPHFCEMFEKTPDPLSSSWPQIHEQNGLGTLMMVTSEGHMGNVGQ
jgi:hypothetical protein